MMGTIRIAALAAVLAVAGAAGARAELCAEGQAANQYEAWQWIENNAKRTADAYAAEREPRAFFANAKASALYQAGGQFKGEYLVQLVFEGKEGGVSLAMLKPNFPFCSDPSALDDERKDLFQVVNAKYNGAPF